MHVDYQLMEEMVKIDNCKLFLAQPLPSKIPYSRMTDVQKCYAPKCLKLEFLKGDS